MKKTNEEFMATVRILYLNQHRTSLAECYRIAVKGNATLKFPKAVPSFYAVRKMIQAIPRELVQQARGIA